MNLAESLESSDEILRASLAATQLSADDRIILVKRLKMTEK